MDTLRKHLAAKAFLKEVFFFFLQRPGVPAGGLFASFLQEIGLLLECELLGLGLVPILQSGYKVIKLLGPGHYLPVVRTPLSRDTVMP